MKLKLVVDNSQREKLSAMINKPVMDNLRAYHKMFETAAGHNVPFNLVVEEMLKQFMQEDREFQTQLKQAGNK